MGPQYSPHPARRVLELPLVERATFRELAAAEPVPAEALRGAPPAIRTVEAAIPAHHVLVVGYQSPDKGLETLTVEPLAIRYNPAHHVVLYCWLPDQDTLASLRLDRIASAEDTGRSFEPRTTDV